MKIAIINSRDLGDRWDAQFHIANDTYKEDAEVIARTLSPQQAMDLFEAIPTAALEKIAPLCRQANSVPKRDQLLRAASEYPFLALAIIRAEAKEVLEAEKTAALERAEKMTKLVDADIRGLDQIFDQKAAAPADLGWLSKVDSCTESAIRDNNFVRGVVYFDGSEYSIPVETSKTAYVADCWVIEAQDFRPGEIDRLIEEGNVPVPRRPADLGQPVGYLDLPGHSQNYGMGWRR